MNFKKEKKNWLKKREEADCQCRRCKRWLQSLSQEDLLEEEMASHSSILAWKIHGQRSPADHSSWGQKESDTTVVT